jgi:hypothetical protein
VDTAAPGSLRSEDSPSGSVSVPASPDDEMTEEAWRLFRRGDEDRFEYDRRIAYVNKFGFEKGKKLFNEWKAAQS